MAAGLWDVLADFTVMLPLIILICCIACQWEEENVDAGRAAVTPASHAHLHPPAPVVERRAAPVAVKKELGYFPYSAAVTGHARGASSVVCAICLDVLVEGAACSEVPACRHLFHRDCIELWMKSNNTCPLCRDLIVPGSELLSAAEDMV